MIRIDGFPVEPADGASIVETEPGVYSVLSGAASYEVRVCGGEVYVDGRRFAVEFEDPRRWKRPGATSGSEGRSSIVAPMPGKVVRVLAAVGDEVAAGERVVVVEAMKMQNELKSPRAGRVTAVHVKDGDGVNAGAVLAVVE